MDGVALEHGPELSYARDAATSVVVPAKEIYRVYILVLAVSNLHFMEIGRSNKTIGFAPLQDAMY
jgi:hypothetical protein